MKILQKFIDLGVKFYTFQFFWREIHQAVRGLPINYEIGKIKTNFEDLVTDLEIKNIRQLYQVASKTLLPLFEISFRSSKKITEKLEKTKILDNIEICIERINPKYVEIPICKSCLNYGHTKRYCKIGITCIICNGPRFSTECPVSIKAKEENTKIIPICFHCKESHFTTWKGCKFYKKFRKATLKNYKKQNTEKPNTPGMKKEILKTWMRVIITWLN